LARRRIGTSLGGCGDASGGARMRDQVLLKVQTLWAAAFAVSFVVTVIDPEWVETVFGVDPDRGNGALEWLFSAALFMAFLASAGLVRRTWRRIKPMS
jgi:hypothetical protein